MPNPTPFDTIKLRQRKTGSETPAGGEENTVTLAEKLGELFGAGYHRDDIYGVVIPLLIQGKVRVDIGGRSERLEMEDQDRRMPRGDAVRGYEEYVAAAAV
jgi:hypothetical protein